MANFLVGLPVMSSLKFSNLGWVFDLWALYLHPYRAMCLIDFGVPVCEDDYIQLPNGSNLSLEMYDSPKNAKIKRRRKRIDDELKPAKNKNFDFFVFRNPAMFVSYISETSLLVVEKSWEEVRKAFGAPVHRHVFGT